MKKLLTKSVVFLCTLLCLACLASAFADNTAEEAWLKEEEWSWNPGDLTTFVGGVKWNGEDMSGTVWKMTLKTNDSVNQGEIVFTEINGHNISHRKRSSKVTAGLLGGGTENSFKAQWYIPDSAPVINMAEVEFILEDSEGNTLAAARMSREAQTGSEIDREGRMLLAIYQLRRILIGAVILIGAAAAVAIVLRRKRPIK